MQVPYHAILIFLFHYILRVLLQFEFHGVLMPFLLALKEERENLLLVFSLSHRLGKLDNRYFYSTRVPVHKFLTFFPLPFSSPSILQYLQRDSHQRSINISLLQDVVSFSPVLLHITKAALYIDLLKLVSLVRIRLEISLQSYLF